MLPTNEKSAPDGMKEHAASLGVSIPSMPLLPAGDRYLVGHARMAEYTASLDLPVSKSTLQKRCSPAINTGPRIVAYFGAKPVTSERLLREWLFASLRPVDTEAA